MQKKILLKVIPASRDIRTTFIFAFDEYNIIVNDTRNNVKLIYCSRGDIVTIKNSKKKRNIFLYKGAILKTSKDSIDIEEDYVKLKGYMGIIDKENKKFYVNKQEKFTPEN